MPKAPLMATYNLLARAAPLLRLPTSPEQPPEVAADGTGLRCAATGRIYPYRGGVLDLLEAEPDLTITQRTLDTRFTAWAYDRFRGGLTRLLSVPDFPEEAAMIQATLQVRPGDTLLDLACGPGNFTVEWAKRAGPDGLVIGLDISRPMLARAAHHTSRWGLGNVLLVHGDAHRLPFADGSLSKVNCSGGFHQFPDLPRALREIARVSRDGAVLTASTFAEGPADRRAVIKGLLKRRADLYFVQLEWLQEELGQLGYRDCSWSLPGGWFGYISARKAHEEGSSEAAA